MGVVYTVEQLSTGRRLALKLMHSELVHANGLVKKFEQEMKIASRIESDHVAHVVGAGVEPVDRIPWFAMELLHGETLEKRIERVGAMPPSEVLRLLEQICHALGAAHASGIVHRDLKPENIFLAKQRMVGRSEIVKVLDFGIARVRAEAGTTRTEVIGTPLYMAPEQYNGSGIRPQTDLWALGLITFRLLTAKCYWRMSEGETTAERLMYQTCLGELVAASERAAELGASVPAGFDAFFVRSVAREQSERYATASDFLESLRVALVEPTPVLLESVSAGRASAEVPAARTNAVAEEATVVPKLAAIGDTKSLAAQDVPEASDHPNRLSSSRFRMIYLGPFLVATLGGSCWLLYSCSWFGTPPEPGLYQKDETKVIERNRRACDGGSMQACTDLGVAFENGTGVPKDQKRAFELYTRACDGENMLGCINLGFAFKKGDGVPKDQKRAVGLYTRACDAGALLGCTYLGITFETGEGMPKDQKRAVELYTRACDGGDLRGCTCLGLAFENGTAVAKDQRRAVELYTRSCEGGDEYGCAGRVRLTRFDGHHR
ncbi:MAG: putative serine/threonine-protein kinase pknH [Myxococcaceae bacterium]|nr:putative serine/threonine-protein kinase pknH [Myxococcaceae bacterium]